MPEAVCEQRSNRDECWRIIHLSGPGSNIYWTGILCCQCFVSHAKLSRKAGLFFLSIKKYSRLLVLIEDFSLFILQLSCSQTSKLLLRTLQLLQWFEGVRCGAYAPLFRWLENQIYGCRKMDRKIAMSMGVISAAVWGILKCRLKRASGARELKRVAIKSRPKTMKQKGKALKKAWFYSHQLHGNTTREKRPAPKWDFCCRTGYWLL